MEQELFIIWNKIGKIQPYFFMYFKISSSLIFKILINFFNVFKLVSVINVIIETDRNVKVKKYNKLHVI